MEASSNFAQNSISTLMKKALLFFFALTLYCGWLPAQISLNLLGSYQSGIFDDGAAEIVAHDSSTQRLYVVNGGNHAIDILSISNPASPSYVSSIDISAYGDNANSVASWNGFIAVAVQDTAVNGNGSVVFFDASGIFVSEVKVGVLPDMVMFTPNGNWVLTANEGEPSDDYQIDPNGSVSIIDISAGISNLGPGNVTTLDFSAFNGTSLDPSVRIFGNNGASTVAQDLEPEYIAVSPDSRKAFVSCQENNAYVIIDIQSKSVLEIKGLGFKDHSLAGNGLDASNRADLVNIANWPVYGMYQPDAIASFQTNGSYYLISANEGDARDYDAYSEEVRIKSLDLDSAVFTNAAYLQNDSTLGRLRCTDAMGDIDNDGFYEELYVFGGRSFSIWDSSGTLVYDSGDEIETRTLAAIPDHFNSNNDDNDSFKARSDDKGPEPEAVTTAELGGKVYAFIGLERVGGIMVYDVSNPQTPTFIEYVNNRNFDVPADSSAAGDLGPEGLLFIPAQNSPNGNPLLVSANEISGTTTVYEIDVLVGRPDPAEATSIRLFPNPTEALLHVQPATAFEILDLQGRVLLEMKERSSVNTESFAKGVYLLKTAQGSTHKFIVR